MSATIEVVDDHEHKLGHGRFSTDRAGYASMLKYAKAWPERIWADRDIPYLTGETVETMGPDRCRVTAGAWSWAGFAASIARADADMLVRGGAAATSWAATAFRW